MPTIGRLIFQRGFDPQIDYDEAQVERLRAAMERHPCIFLWSHRSNLDNLVLTAAMQEKGLPPAHLFAGINMAFGPMGAILRRAGVIFIRRSTSDDPLYKYVLREYVGYVLEKRFNLSWSIEGTRSRTGKMLPPRLGLLSYAADAYLQGRVDDIMLLPVSITFDQLHEIAEYAEYARGGDKKPEGFGWLYGFIKAQGARHYGKIYVRFGEPVSLSAFLGPPGGPIATDPAARRLALAKTAFEVAWRINQGMPVTATAAGHHHPAGHAGRRPDLRPDPPGPGRRAGLPGQPRGAADRQRTRAVRRRGGAGHAGRAAPGRPGHLLRGRPRAGLADRARPAARRHVLPELADPLPARYGAVRAGRAPGQGRRRRPGWGLLGGDRLAPRPAEVRVLLQGPRRAPAPGRAPRWPGTTRPGKSGSGRGRSKRTRCWPGCGRWCPTSWFGRSWRPTGSSPTCWPRRRADRRLRGDPPGARARPAVRGPAPAAQLRVGLGAAVPDGASAGQEPGPARSGPTRTSGART